MADVPNGNGNGTPWWAKSIWSLGPLAAIALILVGVLIGFVPSPLASLDNRLTEIKAKHDEQTRVLRVICRNTAQDPIQRERCEDQY